MIDPPISFRQQALDGLDEIMSAVGHSRHTIAAQLGLNVSDMSALSHIDSHGAIGQTDLAAHLVFSTSSITTLIDRLEAKGLLQRGPHVNDRRRTIVTITDHGRDTVGQIRDWYATALEAVPDKYLNTAATTLTAIADALAKRGHEQGSDSSR